MQCVVFDGEAVFGMEESLCTEDGDFMCKVAKLGAMLIGLAAECNVFATIGTAVVEEGWLSADVGDEVGERRVVHLVEVELDGDPAAVARRKKYNGQI